MIYQPHYTPYADSSLNQIYNMLFCDDLALYQSPYGAVQKNEFDLWEDVDQVRQIAESEIEESRKKLLASRFLVNKGAQLNARYLLGICVELGMEDGLDTLASYIDGTARYINYSGSMVIWEDGNHADMRALTNELFTQGFGIVQKIGPWEQARKSPPESGFMRLSFLLSDGLAFGEGPINVLFNDAFAAPTLQAATALMQFLVENGSPTQ